MFSALCSPAVRLAYDVTSLFLKHFLLYGRSNQPCSFSLCTRLPKSLSSSYVVVIVHDFYELATRKKSSQLKRQGELRGERIYKCQPNFSKNSHSLSPFSDSSHSFRKKRKREKERALKFYTQLISKFLLWTLSNYRNRFAPVSFYREIPIQGGGILFPLFAVRLLYIEYNYYIQIIEQLEREKSSIKHIKQHVK